MEKKVSFGTDGVRGHAQEHPFVKESLRCLGAAISSWANKRYGKVPKVLIGCDTRISGPRIKNDLVNGLSSFPVEIIDGGILTTPAVYRLISIDETFSFGIAISASHNPYHDNGIKLFDAKKCKLSRQDEAEIEKYFELYYQKSEDLVVGSVQTNDWLDAGQAYLDFVYMQFGEQYLKDLKIVLDCANGASFEIAPKLFKKFGASVITIEASPSGQNINHKCGSTYPNKLKEAVLAHKADIGFAFDGDGDRVIAVNKLGQIKDGDDILTLLINHPAYREVKDVVATITSNQGFEIALNKAAKSLIRTQVGDKYVAVMLEEKNLPIGGESCGHIIIKDYMITGDGIFVALKTLESVIANQNWEMRTFDKYPQVSINIPVKEKRDLSKPPYSDFIKMAEESIKDSRIVVRYSGTENLLRIMTEAVTDEAARAVANNLANKLQEALAK
jgi:phosphoglucosamine mutase